ncbi:MAG: hypothetical protein JW891_00025 [Candidatus Lokiarchaeota archaeon]|nr:hypothetical protein [Candidatus Lokiarchaeota archaeon]
MSSLICLSKEEDVILELIQDYMENNRAFKYEKIVPYIRNNFARTSRNINETGIMNILEALVQKRVIIPGSKLTKRIVLQNLNRRKIYDFIKNNPGLYLNIIIRRLNMPNHVITWHLDILVKFGQIKKVFLDNHDAYFHPKIKPSNYLSTYLLSNPKCQKIISYIKQETNKNNTTKTGISRALKIHYNTVSKYLLKLEKLGLVKKEIMNHHKTYYRVD